MIRLYTKKDYRDYYVLDVPNIGLIRFTDLGLARKEAERYIGKNMGIKEVNEPFEY